MTARGFQQQPTTIIIKNYTSNAAGLASFIFGLISIFWLAPLFVPLAVLMGIIAIISRQFAWAVIGLLYAFIGFLTSPILMGIFGVATVASVLSTHPNTVQQQAQQLEIKRQNFVSETNRLVQQMQSMDTRINAMSQQLPKVEEKYHAITAKVGAYYDKAQSLSGNRNGVIRGQIIVAMNQGVVATDQLNVQVQSTENDFRSSVMPLVHELASMEQNCPGVDLRVREACQRLASTGATFKADSKVLAEGLKTLDKTYQNELAAQQALIDRADQIQ